MGTLGALGPFPVTSWSLIGRVRSGDAAARREALGQLLNKYLPALRARLVVDRRINPARAADVLQGFVADKIVEQDLIGRADRERGKFRSFVLTALDRYLIDRLRADAAGSRGVEPDDSALERVAASDTDVCSAFVQEWARQVIAQAVDRLQAECAAGLRPDLWALFRGRVLDCAMNGAAPAPYEQLMAEFGFVSTAAASNALITAKRMFYRSLRAVVGEYVADPEQIDAEIADLRAALAGG